MKLLRIISIASFLVLEVSSSPLFGHGIDSLGDELPKAKRSIPETHIRHEKRTYDQGRRWAKVKRAEPSATLPVRIGLRQANLQAGHDLLMDISDPKSKNYGKHLSAEDVTELFSPPESSFEAVKEWLTSAGIPPFTISRSINKQWVQFDAPVGNVEDLLMTDYHIYEHADSKLQNIACEEYHVPKHIQEHIDYITPGIKLMGLGDPHQLSGIKRSTGRGGGGPSRFALPVEVVQTNGAKGPNNEPFRLNGGCDIYMTPDCIRKLYKIPKATKADPDNKLGVFQSLGQHYTQEDLDIFFWGFTDDIPNGTHPELRSVDGGVEPATNLGDAGSEANLDFQMAYGLIWPQQAVVYQVDDEVYQYNQTTNNSPYKGFFNNFWNAIDGSYCTFSAFNETGNCDREECLDPSYPNPDPKGYKGELMCGAYNRTNVITISYSGGESDLPYSYQQRQCAEVMKLGLQGTTVLIASGDDGVASFSSDPRPNGCIGPNHTVFNPQFLSTCPYILSVGSTYLPSGSSAENGTEVATARFASGGGFSNVFERPIWQEKHVTTYLANAKLSFDGYDGGGVNYTNAKLGIGRYNRLGRAYPDVAANGDNFVVSNGGDLSRIGGTSASSPLFGSILNLINEERLAAGKSTVGFVHQVLYDHPEVFNDITTGSNRGCGTTGFPAATGWDPVSGLGTPNYPKLLDLFMSLP